MDSNTTLEQRNCLIVKPRVAKIKSIFRKSFFFFVFSFLSPTIEETKNPINYEKICKNNLPLPPP